MNTNQLTNINKMKNILLLFAAIITLASCQKTETLELKQDNVIRVEIVEQTATDVTKNILFMVETDTINNSQRFTDEAAFDWSVNPDLKYQIITILCSAETPFNCTYKVFVNDKLIVTKTNTCEYLQGGFKDLKINLVD